MQINLFLGTWKETFCFSFCVGIRSWRFFSKGISCAHMPIFRITLAVVSTAIAALIAYLLFDVGPGSWYEQLAKPDPSLPTPLWQLLWMLSYIILAFSSAVIWTAPPGVSRDNWIKYYYVHLLFNLSVPLFLFALHAILLTFVQLLFFTLLVAGMLTGAYDRDKRVMWALFPYLAVVIYTAYLVLNIWRLN